MGMGIKNRAYLGIGMSVLALALGSFIYTNHAAEQEGRNFCALVGTLDAAYAAQPPQTATGHLVAAEVHALYESLHCLSITPPAGTTGP